MYEYLEGKYDLLTPTHVVVDVGGIGFFMHISLNTYGKIKDQSGGRLYASFQVREDAQTLYGFADREERQLFEMLISVSGVGPSIGRMILSSLGTEEVFGAITTGNVGALRSVKGIGPKTAQRIILELQDKLGKQGGTISNAGAGMTGFGAGHIQVQEEAAGALVLLGFPRAQIDKCLAGIVRETPGLRVEDLIKEALKRL